MYKVFLVLLVLLVACIFIFLNLGILSAPTTLFSSLDFDLSFRTAVDYTPSPTLENGNIVVTRPSVGNQPSSPSSIIVERVSKGGDFSLPIRVASNFRSPIYDESTPQGTAASGVLFSWTGNVGEEKGYGFDCENFLCLVVTNGYSSADSSFGKEFNTIVNSIAPTTF